MKFLLVPVHCRCPPFVAWMDTHGEDPNASLDEALSEFFRDLFLEKGGTCRSYAEAALSGIIMFVPCLKKRLAASSVALRGWRKLAPSKPYPPLTWDLTVCIAVHMTSTGH